MQCFTAHPVTVTSDDKWAIHVVDRHNWLQLNKNVNEILSAWCSVYSLIRYFIHVMLHYTQEQTRISHNMSITWYLVFVLYVYDVYISVFVLDCLQYVPYVPCWCANVRGKGWKTADKKSQQPFSMAPVQCRLASRIMDKHTYTNIRTQARMDQGTYC